MSSCVYSLQQEVLGSSLSSLQCPKGLQFTDELEGIMVQTRSHVAQDDRI